MNPVFIKIFRVYEACRYSFDYVMSHRNVYWEKKKKSKHNMHKDFIN